MRRLLPTAIAVSLAAATLFFAGCSSNAWSSRSSSQKSELTEIKQRIITLERQQAMLTVELRHLRDELAAQGRGSMGSSPAGGAPAAATEARSQSRKAQGEEQSRSATNGSIEESSLPAENARRAAAGPEEPVGKAAPMAPAPAPPVAPAASPSKPVPAAGQALYDRGYTQYHQGHYREAESTFGQFLSHYGETDLGDNALYWIGESRYSLGEYDRALAAFKRTVERYPNGNKVPDALLKAGQCLEQLGNKKGARATYEEVVRRFAGTAAATLASERLHAIR